MGTFTFSNLISAVRLNGLGESFLPPMILNMTITGSVVILFVLLARLALKKAPKIFSYALWAVVLFRLLCPVSITTEFSLLGLLDTPAVENTQYTTAVEYIPYDVVHTPDLEVQLPVPPAINDAVNDALPQEHAALGADPLEGEFAIGSLIWLLGIGVMAIYSVGSYLLLRRKLIGSVLLRDNIYLADGIGSPFVMGFIRPKIYLPSALSEQEQTYIILHEQHHIRRGDHIIKALAFIALCIHWFNPLVWIAFFLSSKDMEMSCDEAVVKKLGESIRADYSASLLSLATGRRIVAGTPLAFGEGDTKSRIKNMLNWKKPKTWIMLVALVACVVAIVFCAANPRNDSEEDGMITWEVDAEYPEAVVAIVNDYVMQQVEHYNDLGSGDTAIGGEYSITDAKVINLTKMVATGFADTKQSVELYLLEYRLLPSEPDHVVLAGGMQMEDGWITEWGSVGQPYLALLNDWTTGESIWALIGTTNTDLIETDYRPEESLGLYEDKYAAAAMELYNVYMRSTEQANYGIASDVSYYLELAAGIEFQNMDLERQTSILVEYEDLLDDYTLIARESKDGTTAYIVGQYNGSPTESPLYGMYSIDMYTNETEYFRFLYREDEVETVEAVVAANKTEFPPSAGYRIEDSLISWTDNSGVILIQPKDNSLLLDVPWNRYFYTPNGREYIVDAVSRGIDICGRTDTYLYIYRISEQFGEIAERIALTEAEAQAILAEERVRITDGFGFSASLHIDEQTTYYNEREGIPQTVLDLAVEKCEYQFATPDDITGDIVEATLDMADLDTMLRADKADLPRLKEILKNAELGYVGSCGYGAKLTLTFTGGEKMTVFKGCDGCDTIVFGSYGGYFLGEQENIEFWEMFGLDPDTTKVLVETNPAEAPVEEEEPSDEEQESIVNTPFAGQALSGQSPLNGMFERTYETQLHMMRNIDRSYPFFENRTLEFDSCAVLLGEQMDQEDYSRSGAAYILFRDGAMRQLPLPVDFNGRTVCPDTVQNPTSNALTYSVEAVGGTCYFVVDLSNRTVSMGVGTEPQLPNTSQQNLPARDTLGGTPLQIIQSGIAFEDATTYLDNLMKDWESHGAMTLHTSKVSIPDYSKENTHQSYLVLDDTIYILPRPFVNESLDCAELVNDNLDMNQWTYSYEAVVPETVQLPDSTIYRAGRYTYLVDLLDLTYRSSLIPAEHAFGPADVEFSDQAITTVADSMTYDERLVWVQAEPEYGTIANVPLGQYAEGGGCLAYTNQWVGVPHSAQYGLSLRFADGTVAEHLPLPQDSLMTFALPDTLNFKNGKLIYEVTFPTQEVMNEGQTLVHLKGTYHYEVDLADKTLSLTIIP